MYSFGKQNDKVVKYNSDFSSTYRTFLDRLSWHQFALAFIVVLVVYQRLTSERSVSVIVENPKFLPLKPGESVSPPKLHIGDYSRLIDLNNFRFNVNSFPCNDTQNGLFLMVIVCSNPINFRQRKIIRKTWGNYTEATRLVFLVGDVSNDETALQLKSENSVYGDIVQGNFKDAYRNMTYKHVMGLKWVTYHCPNARYILKMDDDAIVNMKELHRFLAHIIGPWGAENLIACQFLENNRVQRSYRSKWRVSPLEYPHYYYPDYCAGWAILYSSDVVRKLYVEAQKSNYFWIDDVHLTGVLAEQAGIPRTPFGKLQLSKAALKMLTLTGYNPKKGIFLFGPPDLSVTSMTEGWELISHSYENECNT